MGSSEMSVSGMVSGADHSTAAIVVNATADAWTVPLRISRGYTFALELQAAVGATVNVNVDIEVGNELPTNYNAADGNFVQYEGYSSPTINLTDKNKHIVPISPVPSKFLRVKLDGQAGNAADTTVTVKLIKYQAVS